MSTYPRETTEFVHIIVTVDGQTVTDNISFSIVPRTARKPRPDTWTAATILDGRTGFLLEPAEPGDMQVWARITDTPEAPVIDCGTITRT